MRSFLIAFFLPFIVLFYKATNRSYRAEMLATSMDDRWDLFITKYNTAMIGCISGRPLSIEAEVFLYDRAAIATIRKVGNECQWRTLTMLLDRHVSEMNVYLEQKFFELSIDDVGHVVSYFHGNGEKLRASKEIQTRFIHAHRFGIDRIMNPDDDAIQLDKMINKL